MLAYFEPLWIFLIYKSRDKGASHEISSLSKLQSLRVWHWMYPISEQIFATRCLYFVARINKIIDVNY
jgi:hypothetical protein